MNSQAQNVLTEAMKLSALDREELAARLMGGVELEAEDAQRVEQAWREEVARRVADSDANGGSIPIEEAWPHIRGDHG